MFRFKSAAQSRKMLVAAGGATTAATSLLLWNHHHNDSTALLQEDSLDTSTRSLDTSTRQLIRKYTCKPLPTRDYQMSKLQATSKENPLDVLVVGGGCTGSGTALDAATRGLSTALVERYDFGSETSSRSTKLIWAGVCVYIFITIVECVSFQYIIVNSPYIFSLVVYIHY